MHTFENKRLGRSTTEIERHYRFKKTFILVFLNQINQNKGNVQTTFRS